MIMHQIEALAAVGVKDVVLAVNYRPEIMENRLKEVSSISFLPCQGFTLQNGTPSTNPGPLSLGRRDLWNQHPLLSRVRTPGHCWPSEVGRGDPR